MNNQNFKIFGKEAILKDSKITIVEIDDFGNKKIKPFLFRGKVSEVEVETEVGLIYEIYISYKDSLANVLKFENVMRNANDHINHLYMEENNGTVSVLYIGRKDDINKKNGFKTILVPKDEFYKINGIEKEEEIKKYNQLFFNEN